MSRTLAHRPSLESLEARLAPAVFNVNSLADLLSPPAGVVTLRSAIQAANASPGPNAIDLTVPGTYRISTFAPISSGGSFTLDNSGGPFLIAAAGNLTIANTSGGAVTVAGTTGGVFAVTSAGATPATVTFQGLTITGGYSFGHGGGLLAYGPVNVVLNSVIVEGNLAAGDGGGIDMAGTGSLTLNASQVASNVSYASGGGIADEGSGPVAVNSQSSIADNSANSYGGGIFLDGGSLGVLGTVLRHNTTSKSGGGIFNGGSGDVSLTATLLVDNDAQVMGGGFGDGSDPGYGLISPRGNLSLLRSFILSNVADGGGGGVSTDGATVTVEDSSLDDNTAFGYGGGLYIGRGSTTATTSNVTVSDSEVDGNRSTAGGGGIDANTPNLILENSTISSNSTTQAGGGLLIPAGSGEIGGDLFVGNYATSGGAIDAEGETASYLFVQSSRLSGNVAAHGGAIDVAGSNASGHPVSFLLLLYDTLDGNRSLADGGALSASFTGGGGNLWDDTFTSNSTGTGGAGTKGYGGAIYLTTGDATSGLNLVDLTINGNSASLQGGGIDHTSGTLSVENTIIAGNTAAGSPSDYAYVGGTLTDKGGNLLGSQAGSNKEFGVSTVVGNPLLGPLEDNGGFIAGAPSGRQVVPTEALLPGSPAIARGIAGVMGTDERLFPRLGTTAVPSIGAYWPQYASNATPNQVFVENLYEVLLNRTADSAGLAADTAFLGAGGTPLALVQILESSTEYLDDEVIDLYLRYLGRSLSPAETNAVAAVLKSGMTPEQVATGLVGSAEFSQDYGGDVDVFVQAGYRTVLDRTASAAETSAWDQAMANGLSSPAAAAILLSSQEYLTDLIQDDFAADLGRAAQPADVSLYLSAAAMGATSPLIRAILLAASFGSRT